jgi:ribonucleotide reductase beta subunit family protein with ferritin-like domain
MSSKVIEPLLVADDNRFVMFPIKHDDIWKMYQKQVDCFWRPEEIDLTKDLKDWDILTQDERFFISMILAFFAASDGIVLENLAMRFMSDVQLSEARAFYGFQIAMENIHSHTYSLLIETYIKNSEEKNRLFNAIDHFPSIKKKSDWAQKWIHDNRSSFATRLIAFACVEGIFFSGAFCSIFWIKKRGLLPGLTFSNELISRDEALHCEFAVLLYSKLLKKMSKARVHEIIKEAVEIEIEFICEALPCRLIGMNSQMMTQYIQFVADRLCVQLGYEKIYNVTNSCDYMELISLESKGNMFERKIGEYGLANKTQNDDTFILNEDF